MTRYHGRKFGGEQGVPEKYVRLVKDTYEDARTQVKACIGVASSKITVRVGLHQGSSLSSYLAV